MTAPASEEKRPREDWLPLEYKACVTCPDCGFSFASEHEDAGTGFTCPVCGEERLRAALAERTRERDEALREQAKREEWYQYNLAQWKKLCAKETEQMNDGPRLQQHESTPEPGPMVGPDPGREGNTPQGDKLPLSGLRRECEPRAAAALQAVSSAGQKEVAHYNLERHLESIAGRAAGGAFQLSRRDTQRLAIAFLDLAWKIQRLEADGRLTFTVGTRSASVAAGFKAGLEASAASLARAKSDAAACAEARRLAHACGVGGCPPGLFESCEAPPCVAARNTLAWAREEKNDGG